MKKISAEDVRKVAELARLDLPDQDISTYACQLEKIITYVAQLEKIETVDVIPTTRALEVLNVTRDDNVKSTSVREELLELAPHREGDFFRVPQILAD